MSNPRNDYRAPVLWPRYRCFGFQALEARRGAIDAEILGGAQIDPYGSLNAICIGDYSHPETGFDRNLSRAVEAE